MTETEIEAVARAIYKQRYGYGYISWSRWQKSYKDLYRADARAAIAALDKLRGWQPIETAPKDGTQFIAGRFVRDPKDKRNGRIRVDYWHSRAAGDGYDGLGNFNAAYWPATHWMPLPTPPEAHHD